MKMPPLKDWFRHTEGSVTYYLPTESTEHLDILKTYWNNPWPTLQVAREHKWGGNVLFGEVPNMSTELYFKRFKITNPRYIHKPSRAKTTVTNELYMQSLGFHTPPLFGLIEKRVGGVRVDSAVIHHALTDAYPAYSWINPPDGFRQISQCERDAFVKAIAQSTADFHRASLFHGDMHVGNIMCGFVDASDITIYWLDNEEGKKYSTLPFTKRANDLKHLFRFTHLVPKEEQQLFWNTYKELCDLDEQEINTLSQQLNHETSKFWRKKGIDYSWD